MSLLWSGHVTSRDWSKPLLSAGETKGRSDVYDLVQQAGLVSDPAYYSGLSAAEKYLNAMHLQKISSNIGKRFGMPARRAFRSMIAELTNLAPAIFLKYLYCLEANDWHWPVADQAGLMSSICLAPGCRLQQEISLALAEIRSAVNDTEAIRAEFLARDFCD